MKYLNDMEVEKSERDEEDLDAGEKLALMQSYVAKHPFNGDDRHSQLSFPQGSLISAKVGQSRAWWWGIYNGKEGWFPPTYVTQAPDKHSIPGASRKRDQEVLNAEDSKKSTLEKEEQENKMLLQGDDDFHEAHEEDDSISEAVQQQRSSNVPGLQQESDFSCGIHEFFFHMATRPNSSCVMSLGMIVLSWSVLFIQLFILFFVIFDTERECTSHDDCPFYERCAGYGWFGGGDTCALVLNTMDVNEARQTGTSCDRDEDCYSYGQDQFLFWGNEYYHDSVLRIATNVSYNCNNTNAVCTELWNFTEYELQKSEECWFIKQNKDLDVSSKYAVVFIFIFVLSFVVDDMDQNARTVRASKYRLELLRTASQRSVHEEHEESRQLVDEGNQKSIPQRSSACTCRNLFLSFNVWAVYYTRGYLLPALTCTATISIIFSGQINVQGVILNGLAITLVGAFDDALYRLLVIPKTHAKTSSEMSAANKMYIEGHRLQKRELVEWIKERVVCLVLLISSCLIIFYPREAVVRLSASICNMALFAGCYVSDDYFPCDSFLAVASISPTLIVMIFAAMDKLIMGAPTKLALRDLFLAPGFIYAQYLLWMVLYLGMNELSKKIHV